MAPVKAETCLFPRGHAEGMAVLRVTVDGRAIDPRAAVAIVQQHRTQGCTYLWLDGVGDWMDPALASWLMDPTGGSDLAPLPVMAIRKLGDVDWPAFGCQWILDGSEALMESETVEQLAGYLSDRAHSHPAVEDLVVELPPGGTHPPSHRMLDMLADFVRPDTMSFLYLHRSYPYSGMIERAVSQASTPWAVRWVR